MMPRSRSTASSVASPSTRPSSLLQASRDGVSNSHHSHDSNDDNSEASNDADSAEDAEDDDDRATSAVPVETLVEHLLAARRALGTIGPVLRGNTLATAARALHVEATVLAAQTAQVRRGMRLQVAILQRVRSTLGRTYDSGRRDFRALLRTLDAANTQLEQTLEQLRATTVAAVFRPSGEAPRTLLDFIDEAGVEKLRDSIKASLGALQNAQTSFDGDLLRFDTDLRALSKAMATAPALPPPLAVTDNDPDNTTVGVPTLLRALTAHAHTMAEDLASLTRHFDLCVTAVRTTEGGPALARWRVDNPHAQRTASVANSVSSSPSRHQVSLSGVIGETDSAPEPQTARERAEMIDVVVQDAAEVDAVVAEIGTELQAAEAAFASVRVHVEQTRASHTGTLDAFRVLEAVGGTAAGAGGEAETDGSRLRSYVAAEQEYCERWAQLREDVADRLDDMDALRRFYEGYANAYDTLLLEAERRHAVEARIATVWNKAQDAVARLVVADATEREAFRQEVGEFLPTDLWPGMDAPPRGAERLTESSSGQRSGKEPGRALRTREMDESMVEDGGGSSMRTVLGRDAK